MNLKQTLGVMEQVVWTFFVTWALFGIVSCISVSQSHAYALIMHVVVK